MCIVLFADLALLNRAILTILADFLCSTTYKIFLNYFLSEIIYILGKKLFASL